MRWRWPLRFGGVLLYAIGVAPALFLHGALLKPITGELLPPAWHEQFVTPPLATTNAQLAAAKVSASPTTDESDEAASSARRGGRSSAETWHASSPLLRRAWHLQPLPVVLMGLFGVAAVMHRHWPATTKILAGGTIAGAIAIIAARCIVTPTGPGSMFGPQALCCSCR
jgi:hypothetical protein